MAKQQSASKAVSMLPDDFVAGGLFDDQVATVVEAVFAPFDYNGNIEGAVLAAKLTLQPDEDGADPVTQYWSAGALNSFKPSEDGDEPTDGDGMETGEGYFVVPVGSRTNLNNNTNWSQLLVSLLDADFPREKISSDIRFLVGLKAHWNRLPPTRKGGQMADGGGKKDVLCVTKVIEEPGGGKAKAGKGSAPAGTKSGSSKGGDASGGGSLNETVAEMVASIAKAEGGPVKKSKLAGLVLKGWKGSPGDKQKATKLAGDNAFLAEVDDCVFDEEEGTLTHTENL